MATNASTELPLGSKAPDFILTDTRSGESVSLAEHKGQPILVMFMCNHCPYVVHILDALVTLASHLADRGVATVAISANDIHTHPADAPERMSELAAARQFGFPYCFDADQTVARAYGALCTPDPFLFDAGHQLYYHGQIDATRPGQGKADGADLLAAVELMLAGQNAPEVQHPSVGCSIKWSPARA